MVLSFGTRIQKGTNAYYSDFVSVFLSFETTLDNCLHCVYEKARYVVQEKSKWLNEESKGNDLVGEMQEP